MSSNVDLTQLSNSAATKLFCLTEDGLGFLNESMSKLPSIPTDLDEAEQLGWLETYFPEEVANCVYLRLRSQCTLQSPGVIQRELFRRGPPAELSFKRAQV